MPAHTNQTANLVRESWTVLVVEDDSLARLALAAHLRDVGYSVIEAVTVTEAVAALTSGTRVHLMLSDVELPGPMGGFSLAIWMRQNCRFIPLILTSGVTSVMEPLDRQHVIPFLAKPYRPEEAEAMIASVLAKSAFARHDH